MKMAHVTIHTPHFDETVQFYARVAELKIQRDRRPARDMVFMAEEAGDTCVEIIGEAEAAPLQAGALSVGFRTDNLTGKREELKQEGFAVSEIISPAPGVSFFFVKDPNGLNIQLISDH